MGDEIGSDLLSMSVCLHFLLHQLNFQMYVIHNPTWELQAENLSGLY